MHWLRMAGLRSGLAGGDEVILGGFGCLADGKAGFLQHVGHFFGGRQYVRSDGRVFDLGVHLVDGFARIGVLDMQLAAGFEYTQC